MRNWQLVSIWSTAAAWLLGTLTQVAAGDFLPPRVSISQYGLGRNGWIFTAWTVAMAIAAVSVVQARIHGFDLAALLITIGTVGCVVMGAVRTDANGLQRSLHAKIHLGAAILVLAALPIGMLLVAHAESRILGRIALALGVVSTMSIILLLMAATGVNTAGGGPEASWAFWQSVAAVCDMLILTCAALAVGLRPDGRGVSDRSPTGTRVAL